MYKVRKIRHYQSTKSKGKLRQMAYWRRVKKDKEFLEIQDEDSSTVAYSQTTD